MFRELTNWLGGKSRPRSGRGHRPSPRMAWLGVERLERRDLLSASVPGFALNNGNLYHTASGQQLIDTCVQSFTVVGSQVFDVQTNGNVELLNCDGSGKLLVGGNMASVVSDASGNVFGLNVNNTVYEHAPGTTGIWNPVAGGMSAITADATGNVFGLNGYNNCVYEHALGTGGIWNPIASGMSEVATDATGNLFGLNCNNNCVYEHALGTGGIWNSVAGGINAMAVDAAGNIFGLNYNNNYVYEHALGTGGIWNPVASGISAIAADGEGNVFGLNYNNNAIYEHALGTTTIWNQVAADMRAIATDISGNVYGLNVDNGVYEHAPGTTTTWNLVAGNISAIATDATGNLFGLNTNSIVYQHALGTTTIWNPVAGSITAIAVDGTGNLFGLNTTNTVYEHALGTGGIWNPVASGISAIATDGTDNLFGLNSSNSYVYEHALGTKGIWNPVAGGISEMAVDGTGNLFGLNGSNNCVYGHALGTAGIWNSVAANMSAIATDPTGDLLGMNTNNSVYEHAPGTAGTWNLVESAVMPGGNSYFALTTGGYLYSVNLSTAQCTCVSEAIPLAYAGRITQFVLTSDGSALVALTSGGYLFTASIASMNWVNTTAWATAGDSGTVSQFAVTPDGKTVFAMTSGGYLYSINPDSGTSAYASYAVSSAGTGLISQFGLTPDGSAVVALTTGGSLFSAPTATVNWAEITLNSPAGTQWTVNQPGYTATVAVNSNLPGSWSITGLPPGVTGTPSGNSLVLAGTPTETGNWGSEQRVQWTVQGLPWATVSESYELDVYPQPTLGALSQAQWTVNQPGYVGTISIQGGAPGFSNLIVTGLPQGITARLSGHAITLSGTTGQTGAFTLKVTAHDSTGATMSGAYNLTVNAAPALGSLSSINAIANVSFSATIPISGGSGPYSALSVTNLPAGLSAAISGNSIIVSGIPSQTGAFGSISATVQDCAGTIATGTYALTVSGYFLDQNGGNLYWVTGNGNMALLTTSVMQAQAEQGAVFALVWSDLPVDLGAGVIVNKALRMLVRYDVGSTMPHIICTSVASYAVEAGSTLLVHFWDSGNVVQIPDTLNLAPHTDPVLQNGTVYQSSPIGLESYPVGHSEEAQPYYGGAASWQLAPDGALLFLVNGNLDRLSPQGGTPLSLATDVTNFCVLPSGDTYIQRGGCPLTRAIDATGSSTLASSQYQQQLAVVSKLTIPSALYASNHSLYELNALGLWEYPDMGLGRVRQVGGGQYVGITAYQVQADGTVLFLDGNQIVRRYDPTTAQVAQIATGVQSLSPAAGTYDPNAPGDQSVATFFAELGSTPPAPIPYAGGAPAPNQASYSLDTPVGALSTMPVVATGVECFTLDGAGHVTYTYGPASGGPIDPWATPDAAGSTASRSGSSAPAPAAAPATATSQHITSGYHVVLEDAFKLGMDDLVNPTGQDKWVKVRFTDYFDPSNSFEIGDVTDYGQIIVNWAAVPHTTGTYLVKAHQVLEIKRPYANAEIVEEWNASASDDTVTDTSNGMTSGFSVRMGPPADNTPQAADLRNTSNVDQWVKVRFQDFLGNVTFQDYYVPAGSVVQIRFPIGNYETSVVLEWTKATAAAASPTIAAPTGGAAISQPPDESPSMAPPVLEPPTGSNGTAPQPSPITGATSPAGTGDIAILNINRGGGWGEVVTPSGQKMFFQFPYTWQQPSRLTPSQTQAQFATDLLQAVLSIPQDIAEVLTVDPQAAAKFIAGAAQAYANGGAEGLADFALQQGAQVISDFVQIASDYLQSVPSQPTLSTPWVTISAGYWQSYPEQLTTPSGPFVDQTSATGPSQAGVPALP